MFKNGFWWKAGLITIPVVLVGYFVPPFWQLNYGYFMGCLTGLWICLRDTKERGPVTGNHFCPFCGNIKIEFAYHKLEGPDFPRVWLGSAVVCAACGAVGPTGINNADAEWKWEIRPNG